MFKIETTKGHERMSTQDLLLAIEEAVKGGETEFEIKASGQHDIGGPLWHPEGKALHFHVWNAGQRVGSMCLPGTEILVEESTSADVGWLNAGGIITVKGDAGDTAGHCSSAGKIFIGGRGGTRTGSLMKHDPLYEEPELWILKNVGSFSFEFMGGGKAVVCGYDSEGFASVLGERACVGMVGGVVYTRGSIGTHPADIKVCALDAADIAFLEKGMDEFLEKIDETSLRGELTDWAMWHKLRPLTKDEKASEGFGERPSVAEFRRTGWVKGGIFADVAHDDFEVHGMLSHGLYRLRVPVWENTAAPLASRHSAATTLSAWGVKKKLFSSSWTTRRFRAVSVVRFARIPAWTPVRAAPSTSPSRSAAWASFPPMQKFQRRRKKPVRRSPSSAAVLRVFLLLGSLRARDIVSRFMTMPITSAANSSR